MNFQQAIVSNLKRFVDFNGRSARSEYWWWVLMQVIIGFAFGLLEALVGGPGSAMYALVLGLNYLVSLGLLLPSLGVAVRRLHDTNRSGWWYLIAFTIIGLIPLIIWFATRGTVGENQYGPDPLPGSDSPAAPVQPTWAS